MKICWDNLEGIFYTRYGNFRDPNKGKTGTTYHYKEHCKNCNEPFLSVAGREKFCDIKCSTLNSATKRIGTPLTDEVKRKISEKALERGKFSKEHCQAISDGMSKENHRSWQGGLKEKNLCGYDIFSVQLFDDITRPDPLDNRILQVKCKYCGKWFRPTRSQVDNRIRSTIGKSTEGAEQNLYCSDGCKSECPTYHQIKYHKGFKQATSREVQPQLRQMVLKRDNYTCQKCGSDVSLHCHHIYPLNESPITSADMDECITYCKSCHKEVHMNVAGCGYYEMICSK